MDFKKGLIKLCFVNFCPVIYMLLYTGSPPIMQQAIDGGTSLRAGGPSVPEPRGFAGGVRTVSARR